MCSSDLPRLGNSKAVLVYYRDLLEREARRFGVAEVDKNQTGLSGQQHSTAMPRRLTKQIPAYRPKVAVGPIAFIRVKKVADMTMLAAQTPPARMEAPRPLISKGNNSDVVQVIFPDPVA